MKKVGKLTEARMVLPPEPKLYPMVSDRLFENKVKGYAKLGIKGGTPASAKEAARRKKLKEDEVPDPRDLASNRPPQASLSTTNSPKRATKASVQVGGPFDLTDAKDKDWIQGAEDDIERRGTKGKCTPITKPGCTGKAKALAKTFKKMAKKRDDSIKAKNEAKDDNWIQGAEKDIERRGTEGKCTPITKPGCTGRAKALAKTFKKMAKRNKNEGNLNVGPHSQELANKTLTPDQQAKLKKQRDDWRSKLRPTGDDGKGKTESSTPKPVRQARARAQAGKPIKRGTASTVANDSGSEMSQRMRAAEKL